MSRTALACLLAVVASAAVAAPVPKPLKNKGVDLTALYARIAEQAVARQWSEDDTVELKKTLGTLLDKSAEATGGERWKLPLELGAAKVTIKKGPIAIDRPGVYLIDGDVTEVDSEGCVILATGVVKGPWLEDAIVVAKQIKTEMASNCLLVAAEAVEVWNVIGHKKEVGRECFVVAGKRIHARLVYGGTFHVITPEFPADPKGKPPVSVENTKQDPVLLVLPSDREVGDKGFKKVELKAAIAK